MAKVIKVEWVDSSSDAGRWTTPEEIDNDILEVVSYGFLVKENDRQITLAQNRISNPEQYCQMISIPKAAITNMVELV